MKRFILFLLVLTSLMNTELVYAQPNEGVKPTDFNKSHVIAVVTTGDREILDFLKRKLPHGFELFEVKDEKEGSHDKYWGMLIVKYIKNTSKTQWMFRNTAADDRIEIRLTPKEKYFSTNLSFDIRISNFS